MRTLCLMALTGLAALACCGAPGADRNTAAVAPEPGAVASAAARAAVADTAAAVAPDAGVRANWHLVEVYCEKCHNAIDWAGGVAFDTMSPDSVPADAAIWEKAIRKLGGSIMPRRGSRNPTRPHATPWCSRCRVTWIKRR